MNKEREREQEGSNATGVLGPKRLRLMPVVTSAPKAQLHPFRAGSRFPCRASRLEGC